ncbi:calpain-5-like isoform X2 [Amblyomma americanum]
MARRKGSSSSPSYTSVRSEALKTHQPFVDATFPTDETSLYVKGRGPRVEWKRPSEMCAEPQLFTGGTVQSDVCHDRSANAWFVTVCTVLAGDPQLLAKVIPDVEQQEWRPGDEHPGVFRFCFWLLGSWTEVLVDDRLPVMVPGGLPYGCRSRIPCAEFWAPLLEKAYAKFLGCYELLEACSLSDALVDLTGAAVEHMELAVGGYARDPALQEQLFAKLLSVLDTDTRQAVVCCAQSVEHAEEMGSLTAEGLLRGHTYPVVCAQAVTVASTPGQEAPPEQSQLRLLRLHNPWAITLGRGSAKWSRLSEAEQAKLGIQQPNEHEFWISLEDFVLAFTDMCVCHLPGRGGWREESFLGEWTVGERGSALDRAGGCINYRSSFLRNPQVEVNRQFRVHVVKPKVCSSEYVRARGVFLECQLQRGRYCLLPTTFKAGQTRRFLLRLLCQQHLDARELLKDVPSAKLLPCQSAPSLATIIRVIGAKNLEQQDPFGVADSYCVLLCEGQSVRSAVCHATLNPTWNISAIFYRKDASTPIKIQVWNSHLMMDAYMAKAYVEAPVGSDHQAAEVALVGHRNRTPHEGSLGTLLVEVTTTDDLLAV